MKVPRYINKLVKNKHKKVKRNSLRSFLGASLSYIMMFIFIVVIVGLHTISQGNLHQLYGYSAMTVVGKSMQDVIPQNSLIIVKKVDTSTIKVGDDITYLLGEDIMVTHRVIAIIEDSKADNKRGFQTQGVNNKQADIGVVACDAVIGRVIYHNLIIGQALVFVKTNFFYVLGSGIIFISIWQLLSIWGDRKENIPTH